MRGRRGRQICGCGTAHAQTSECMTTGADWPRGRAPVVVSPRTPDHPAPPPAVRRRFTAATCVSPDAQPLSLSLPRTPAPNPADPACSPIAQPSPSPCPPSTSFLGVAVRAPCAVPRARRIRVTCRCVVSGALCAARTPRPPRTLGCREPRTFGCARRLVPTCPLDSPPATRPPLHPHIINPTSRRCALVQLAPNDTAQSTDRRHDHGTQEERGRRHARARRQL